MTVHKSADHHARAADHHDRAAHHHRQASKHYEEKDYAHAAHQAQIASGHTNHAVYEANEAAKYHAGEHGGDPVLVGAKPKRAV
jgi:hypothetical protein